MRLNVTSIDDGNNLSPGVVYASMGTNGDITTTITLGPGQEAQWIGTVCGTIEYQIYGPEMASLNLVLSTSPGNYPTVIEVELLPCEPWFIFMPSSSTCDCSPFLTSHGVVCDTSDGTVTINKNNWIGVYNNTLPALASFCPLDYCNSTINKLSLGIWGVITAIIRHALAFRIRVAPSRIRVVPSRIRVVPSRIRVMPSRIWVVPSRYSSVTVRYVRMFCYSSVTDKISLSRLLLS